MTKWEQALYLDAFRHGVLCEREGLLKKLEDAGAQLDDAIRMMLAPDLTRDELNAANRYAREHMTALAAELEAEDAVKK